MLDYSLFKGCFDALSIPGSFSVKAFKYLNRQANKFFLGKAELATSSFAGWGHPIGVL